MKKSFKIKKSVVESMVDDAICSLLNEGFDYDDLSQDVMHWALNYADSGHNYPINAVQLMQEWYNGDESALDTVCERFAEWKGIESDDNVRSAVEKAANTIGYYENWNNDKIEFDEAKEAQAVEDMKKKIRSMSQKISSTDEELPELKRQVDALKNKLSTMDESFKSQKLKDFARQHGGLKNGKWSADFKNDLYNMSDEDFDTYKVVNQNDHYRQYGLNGWDTNDYGNNNFQPIEFGDGTFMVKKNPELRWDDRAKGMMDKQIDRRNSRRNDGKNEYQFENPYLNNKFNQDYHISKPRGSWGYGTDWKLEPSNINMTALRSMEGYDKYPGDVQHGDVAAKAKASRKGNVSESKLNNAIQKSIKKVLNEGSQKEREEKCIDGICFKFAYHDINGNPIWCTDNEQFGKANYWRRHKDGLWYGQSYSLRADVDNFKGKTNLNEGIYDYPDGIDHIIFLSENDRELYEEYRQIAKACMKLYKKDVQLTLERLMESSIMKRYQQHCFRKYAKEQKGLDRMNSPREFRRFIAEKIIDEVVNGAWDDKDMMNESLNEEYVWWGDTKPLETIYSAAQEIVRNYADADPEGNYESTAIFDLVKWANEVMDEADKYIHYEAHNTAIGESKLNEENEEQPNQYGYQNVPDEFVEKVGENGYEVLVPDWCLPYLINGDRENYEDDEIAAMDAFVEKYNGKLAHGLNAGDACMPMDGEEPSFYTHNDITGNEGCDCYRVFLPAKESEQMNEGVYPRVKDSVLQNVEWIKIPNEGYFEDGMTCGVIDHDMKTVKPCHGYYFPNPKSRVLRNIAKRLGYQYNDEEFEKYIQKKQNNKKS